MGTAEKKNELLARLRSDILHLQGFHMPAEDSGNRDLGLGRVADAFANGTFPIGMHEFISNTHEQSAATSGFMAALAGSLMQEDGLCIWAGMNRKVYPLALSLFGLSPDRIIFVDLKREKDLLWVIQEALKCDALSVVVGEVRELNLTASRRLQLTIEESRVPGLLHRVSPRVSCPVATVCRWQIGPLPGVADDLLPGIGFPRWQVTIDKVRGGEPGSWQLEWSKGHFEEISVSVMSDQEHFSQAG